MIFRGKCTRIFNFSGKKIICVKHAETLYLCGFRGYPEKILAQPKNIVPKKYYVTGQTFLASKGQFLFFSNSLKFSPFDPPFSSSFSPNLSPVFSFTGQPFMRLTECNLEIKRLLFSPFISGYFSFKGN